MDRHGRFFYVECQAEHGPAQENRIQIREEFRRLGFEKQHLILKPSDYMRKLQAAGIIPGANDEH